MKTKTIFLTVIILALSIVLYSNYQDQNQEIKTIGILAPMAHAAMEEIHNGVKEGLSSKDIKIIFRNAHGDLNTQRAILKQFNNLNVDIIMPIGSGAMLMALKENKDKAIIGLATKLLLKDQLNLNNTVTSVIDEIPIQKHLELISEIIGDLKKITLIYSPAEKIFPELEELKKASRRMELKVQYLMAEKVSDLFSIASAIDDDSQVLFILKDHLIVSGIEGLVKEARKKKIPVITSDEGSVKNGASLALGVMEKDIGVAGAEVALAVLEEENLNLKKETPVKSFKLFINKSACTAQGFDLNKLNQIATKLNLKYKEV
jgi:putative tryptophan/tyrosine transport system substrate-binding protein